jgi:hypothetical protein
MEHPISKPVRAHGRQSDSRFVLHQCQPRADKLDARQRRICLADPAFKEALRTRVTSAARFSAFMDGIAFYIALERPCAKCGNFRKRTRDRSCYGCHLRQSGENFELMKAGLAPVTARSRDSHLDLLERQRAERDGECETRKFGGITVTRWPLGRLEVLFPDGYREHNLSKRSGREVHHLMEMLPEMKHALIWAGWFSPL